MSAWGIARPSPRSIKIKIVININKQINKHKTKQTCILLLRTCSSFNGTQTRRIAIGKMLHVKGNPKQPREAMHRSGPIGQAKHEERDKKVYVKMRLTMQ